MACAGEDPPDAEDRALRGDRTRQPASGSGDPDAARGRGRAAGWGRVAVLLLVLVGLGLAVVSLVDRGDAVRRAAGDLSAGPVVVAGLAVVLSLVVTMLSWRSALAAVGRPVALGAAAKIYFVGQLGKYVPGSVWPVVLQMELGSARGLSRTAVATASLLALALSVPVALGLALLAVPALLASDASAYLLLLLLLPVALVALSPPVLNPLVARALRLARRPPLAEPLAATAVLKIAALAAGAHVLLGLHAWALASDLGAEGALVLPLAVGAFSLANVAGLLALPVPAGAGVREAVLVAALLPVLPVERGLVLALVSRALLTAGDLVVAGGAAATALRGVVGPIDEPGATGGAARRPE